MSVLTAGRVHRARGLRIGYLPQQPHLPGERTLYDEMLTVFANLQAHQAELRELERAMADSARRERALARYGQAQTRFGRGLHLWGPHPSGVGRARSSRGGASASYFTPERR